MTGQDSAVLRDALDRELTGSEIRATLRHEVVKAGDVSSRVERQQDSVQRSLPASERGVVQTAMRNHPRGEATEEERVLMGSLMD